ncbi:hypothetical protein K435DRAFT_774688 [Dendrothele bispora CBS 962.96]|uniref:G-patch domain-containing protein n=1 Tax=Dendrothele bispora (strain CBS 962.96) TaxID=1314807 RepID=A0A4S8MLV7_DENBC|nr:hypothetical protein K435DRAFT_774688 [Dendrothele bispora CBS 962.96]
MPIDGHSFLVSQGWSGKGTGLRQGAITRPITIVQKNNLGGLGKDRDEAFPFWDHVFTSASKAITIKINDSDDDSDNDSTTPSAPSLRRTGTGILSNRRPVDLPSTSSSTSGTSTPEPSSSTTGPRLTLLAQAKREGAKRQLYSKFYRALVLAPETETSQELQQQQQQQQQHRPSIEEQTLSDDVQASTRSSPPTVLGVLENTESKKKRKRKEDATGEMDLDRQERKRLKKEKKARKEMKMKEKMERKALKAKAKLEKEAKKERKRRKKEKREGGRTEEMNVKETESEKHKRKKRKRVSIEQDAEMV